MPSSPKQIGNKETDINGDDSKFGPTLIALARRSGYTALERPAMVKAALDRTVDVYLQSMAAEHQLAIIRRVI